MSASRVEPKSDFEKHRKACLASKKLFEDPDFPPVNSSIYYSKEPPYDIVWLRPHEILKKQGIDKAPSFLGIGPTGSRRFDVKQGDIGNCWMLASVAAVSDMEGAYEWLVPQDQSFDPNWYAGIFRFRFYQYGENVEVYVDDRLPVLTNGEYIFAHSQNPWVFWGALLEKAYSKVHGSYEAIEAGTNDEGLTDFTGGLVENYYLHEVKNLRRLLRKSFSKDSIVAAAIFGDVANPVTSTGLVLGHAYSVTGFGEVKKKELDKKELLVRVRNPWGTDTEWNGSWSDNSIEWDTLTPESNEQLKQKKAEDGEFWMSVGDFKWQFDNVTLCNCMPDSVEADEEKNWKMVIYHGEWKKGVTDGGLPTSKEAVEKNKQYLMKFEDHDEDGLATVVVQVSQKDRRQKHLETIDIGFAIFCRPEGACLPLKFDDIKDKVLDDKYSLSHYDSGRDVCKRFDLEPGEYVIMPTTHLPEKEGQYMMRIFSEASIETEELE